jgi:dTDP-4-amino-4,6-dideoxygalactose transaminase
MTKKIFVTKPDLPPLEELLPYLSKIWDSKVVTNGGAFHQELEEKLCKYLDVPYISLFTNGAVALVTALKALDIKGDVITTPFSFIATSHAILWNNLNPIFVDIDPESLNLDPKKIEKAITPETSAILPVHCYGQPCNVDAIQKIANKYNLKVIYDAAHAFGVKNKSGSILNYGDLSILSFHATKVFNTFEGGAIVCHDKNTKIKIDQFKNFGITDEVTVETLGINGKMSEFNAALGLIQLRYIDEAIKKREKLDLIYREGLKNTNGITLSSNSQHFISNYSYFPIIVNEEFRWSRDDLYIELKNHGVYTRRYFYPLISSYNMYSGFLSANPENLQIASEVSKKILCLPIYPDLQAVEVKRICKIISVI